MRKRGKYARVGWNTGRRRCKPSTSVGRVGHGSGSKPRFPRYGSSGCWPSAGTNCGWGMRPRSGRRRCGSRRRIPPCGTEHLLDLLLTNRFPRIWVPPVAEQTAAWQDEELHRAYLRLKFRRASGVAKVAIARRLAVRLYWMLRERKDYAQFGSGGGTRQAADGEPRQIPFQQVPLAESPMGFQGPEPHLRRRHK